MQSWIFANWHYSGLAACLFLLAMIPLCWATWDAAFLLTFLQLPCYMVHQVEEHHRDRFRVFFNDRVAHGKDALTPAAVVVINVGGVWLVDLAAIYMARSVRPGLGLIAMYLAIVNAVAHIAGSIAIRAYNPGLVTGTLLLLPAGVAGVWLLVRNGLCTRADHAWGLGIAVAIHAAIILWVRVRVARFATTR